MSSLTEEVIQYFLSRFKKVIVIDLKLFLVDDNSSWDRQRILIKLTGFLVLNRYSRYCTEKNI